MSIRCAMCGSKNVYVETKKEGYNLKAGVIGTALVGVPGALAGTVGNDTKYYHCHECGQVLNKPMMSVESDWIDSWIINPKYHYDDLKRMKSKYRNIEWEETTESTTYNFVSNSKSLTELSTQIRDNIIIELQKMNSFVEENILKQKFQQTFEMEAGYSYNLKKLEREGRVKRETIGSTIYIRLINDVDMIQKLALESRIKSECLMIVNMSQCTTTFYKNISLERNYSFDEIKLLMETIMSEIVSKKIADDIILDAYFWDIFTRTFVDEQISKMQVSLTKEGYLFKTDTDAQKERLAQIHEENKVLIDKILKFLNENNCERFKATDLILKSSDIYESNSKVNVALKCLYEEELIEKTVIDKKAYFALPGTEKRLEEKRLREEEETKRRKIEIDKKNEEIRKENELIEKENAEIRAKIDKLEKERNLVNITISTNKNKLFGAGVKARKEAQVRLEEINREISDLRPQIKVKKNLLVNESKIKEKPKVQEKNDVSFVEEYPEEYREMIYRMIESGELTIESAKKLSEDDLEEFYLIGY